MRQKKCNISGVEYTVFEDGRVFSKNDKEIKQRANQDGYATFTAGKKGNRKSVKTHRIVGALFIPNPNEFEELDHLDCDRMNPSATNLEWVTHQENIRRAYARGSHIGRAVGENNPRASLNERIVRNLRSQYDSGISIGRLSSMYYIPWSTVCNVLSDTLQSP